MVVSKCNGRLHNIVFVTLLLARINTTTRAQDTALPGAENAATVTVRKGGDAVLGCEISKFGQDGQLPPYVIQWLRDEEHVLIKVGKRDPHVSRYFEGRISIANETSNASLKITNVTLDDAGWYECQVLFLQDTFDQKSTNGTWVKLEVTDPPSFVETPNKLKIARQGQSLLLKCRATGRPRPVITWRKDGRLLKDGKDGILLSGGDLAVTSLTTSHRGKYMCVAQSVEGRTSFTTEVKVEAPPEFLIRPQDLTTQEGKDAMFKCRATGYPTDMKYRWTYNGDPVESSLHLRGRCSVLPDGSFIIYTINTKDGGNVSCTVENGFGSSPVATASLYVQFRARVTDMPAVAYAGLGLEAILRCPAIAEPPVNKVIWKKGSRILLPHQDPRISLSGDGSLIIKSAIPSDAGSYTCTPRNIVGTLGESTGTDLRVKNPPYFTRKPDHMYEAELGKSITIHCRGEGDPPPAVNWRKAVESDEDLHFTVEMGSLTIYPVMKAVHGTWQCVLKNSVAEVHENVEIYVKYTMPHKVQNVTAQAMSDSAIRVEWTPGYNGGHPQRFIVWYRQPGKVDPSWQTLDVGTQHTAAVLNDLLPDTEYEIAVLPENKIRSGPFSETVNARTRTSRPVVAIKPSLLPAPHALYSSTTDDGLVQLSWRKPQTYRPTQFGRRRLDVAPPVSENRKILGFLVEFRWTSVAEGDLDRRSTRERNKREAKMPERGHWDKLTATYENVTSVVVQPDQLYRDLNYEFRVLAASEKDYSVPSTLVPFSTKGLMAYPCYTGPLQTAAVFDNPVIAGILAAVILLALIVGFLVFWFCRRRRRRKPKNDALADTEEASNNNHDMRNKSAMNGKVIANRQPVVVDLTEKGTGGYGTMEKREYETNASDDEAKTPFIRNSNNIEESSKVFSAFMARHDSNLDSDSRREASSSDRSSVRLRRETAPRVLLEQYKRRSFTDQAYHRIHRDIPLRGGTRSASTSPERNNFFGRADDLNITAPAALEDAKGRRRIRLYSRPIDDSGSAQQRRMIVIKRKSHKSSSSLEGKKNSIGAPPSDSSESPVFGVVGTIKQTSADSLNDQAPKTSSPMRRSLKSPPHRGRQPYHRTPFENAAYQNRHDVTNNKNDDVIFRSPPIDCTSPLYSSSPNDHSSPDVSPNRVVARRTVEYDPKVDPVISPRSYSGSPTRRDNRWNKSNSLTHEQRAMLQPTQTRSEHHKNIYPYSPHGNMVPLDPYERGRTPRYYQNPGYQMVLAGPSRTRYSFAQYPPVVPHQPSGNYHKAHPIHNSSRSRASFSYSHRHPMTVYSPPPAVYDHYHPTSRAHPSTSGSHSTQPSSSDQLRPPQSTCEIDCSNSDIEVRFFKDSNGRADMVMASPTAQSPSIVAAQNAGSAATPSSGNSAPDLRYNLRNLSADGGKGDGVQKNLLKSPSPVKILSPTSIYPQEAPICTPVTYSGLGQTKTRPRHLLSPTGQAISAVPPRQVKLTDGSDCAPTSPPLAAVGSSDYGSQDTSNSSASPIASSNIQASTSPSHLRFPSAVQDRPPRRDNSSVEDNYEWDSEIAMESEILEALRHFGTLKKSGPVSDELLDELNKITKDTKNLPQRQRAHSADILESHTSQEDKETQERDNLPQTASPGPTYSKESMARRCAALRAEFLHYQQLQQLNEDGVT